MPFPFLLPTTSSFSFSSSFTCDSHPSLPLNASTHRGVVRETLKKHKRLPPASQPASLPSVISSLTNYLPYLVAIHAGLHHRPIHGDDITIHPKSPPQIEWRPTLTDSSIPGKEPPRLKLTSLTHELAFALTTLANAHTLLARAALHPLHLTSTAPVGTQQRQSAVSSATKSLLDAASIHTFLASHPQTPTPSCADITPSTALALASLALAEATLLAILKDDPYPAAVAQDRNANDTEWMYKAPDMPKVRAHLFARLCLAAAEHAAQAHSLLSASSGGKVAGELVRYLEDVRRTSRARACRFFGIDAELGGQTGTAIAWLRAGLEELGVERREGKEGKGGGLGRLRKEWSEKREDKKVERGTGWGADGGRLEETRVIEMLEAKWTRQNDTVSLRCGDGVVVFAPDMVPQILTQVIPPTGPLLAQMPSGREIHTVKPFHLPLLDPSTLEAMRAPPDRADESGTYPSSDDETPGESAPGAFPGTQGEYRTGTPSYY